MDDMIIIQNVTKKFKDFKALDNINLNFKKGQIYGIIGRNGSGKTVLFKCICGLLNVDEGLIKINGKQIGKEIAAPKDVGVIIETPGFLPEYSGYLNLKFLADLRKKIKKQDIFEIIKYVGLDPHSKKAVGKYSMGMKQRLGIAQAIMEDPELLILDEPMNGLDNQGVQEIRKLLLELKAKGKTILLASHNREDISVLCDSVIEIDRGKIITNK